MLSSGHMPLATRYFNAAFKLRMPVLELGSFGFLQRFFLSKVIGSKFAAADVTVVVTSEPHQNRG